MSYKYSEYKIKMDTISIDLQGCKLSIYKLNNNRQSTPKERNYSHQTWIY